MTKIADAYGHHIDIVYDPGLTTIQTITDSTDRVVTFVTSGTPKKLTQIVVTDANGNDRIFSYSVGNYTNGYHRLDSFTPPMLPATTFEYLDGSLSCYELSRMTTSYGESWSTPISTRRSTSTPPPYFAGREPEADRLRSRRNSRGLGFYLSDLSGRGYGNGPGPGACLHHERYLQRLYGLDAVEDRAYRRARQAGDGSYSRLL
ncbi:MAG: hypothetical protein MZV64_13430 [Ignavibacteriales bacterium]|nr:hypothetical protein [Ignavibacteriales bacterium]